MNPPNFCFEVVGVREHVLERDHDAHQLGKELLGHLLVVVGARVVVVVVVVVHLIVFTALLDDHADEHKLEAEQREDFQRAQAERVALEPDIVFNCKLVEQIEEDRVERRGPLRCSSDRRISDRILEEAQRVDGSRT
jgi:hypothetical protein